MKKILLVLGFVICWLGSSFATSPRETHELVCSAPQQISAVASQDGKNAKVFFSNTGAAAYVIQYRLGFDSVWTSLDNVTVADSNSLYLKDLKPCAWYVVRVKSVCSPNESSEWRGTEFKTGGCTVACPTPAGLFASARDSIASLNWLATNSSAGYSVMWKAKRSSVWKTENVTTNSLILKGLLPCTEYEFKVKAMCGLTGSSEYTESKSFKTLGCVAPCITPREVKGEGGEGKIGIVWASTAARAYEIQYKIAADSGAWTTVRSATNSFVINGLRSCAKYFVQVRSLCSGDNSTTILFSEWSSQIVVATTGCVTPSRCEPVRRLGFQPTANGAVLVWETVVGAKFEIQFKAKRDSVWKTVTAARSSYELTGLASCTEYQYRVRVYCVNGGTSAWSNVMTFKTTGCQAPCKAPKLVKTYAVDSVAVVTWAGEGSTKFILQYKVADALDWTTLNVSGNVYVLTGLKRCVTYYVRVKSVCSATSMSDYTEIAKFTTGGCHPTTCAIPHDLNGGADQTAAKFIWSNTSARGYIFEYKAVTDISNVWKMDTIFQNYTAIFNLTPCTKYVARVRSLCPNSATSVSLPSELYYFATTCPPTNTCDVPLRGSSQLIQDSTVYLAWSSTASKYEVQYRITTANVDFISVKTDTAFLKLALHGCQIYEWKVRAICADGTVSAWSESRKFETLGCRPNPNTCVAPLTGGTQLVQDSTVYFTWGGSAARKFVVEIAGVPDGYLNVITVDTSVLKLVLPACKIYTWRVKAICADGTMSAWSEIRKFETLGCRPNPNVCVAPINLKNEIIGVDSNQVAYFAWASSSPLTVVEKYEIQYRISSSTTSPWIADSITGYAYKAAVRRCQVYEWRVRKICGNGLYSEWAYSKFETKCLVIPTCPVATLPKITATVDGVAYLIWDSIDSFVIQYRPAADSTWKELVAVVTPNGVILRGLQACKEYKLRVRRICPNGAIQWVETSFKVPGVNCLIGGNGTDVQGLVVRNVVKGLGISPNPGSEYVQVNYELAEPTDVNISLMNLQGQVVSQFNGGKQDAGTYMQTLDNLSELNTGLYMLVIRANGKISVSQKWMKQ
jgi:chitodextrinase